jgi:hypothetical protein
MSDREEFEKRFPVPLGVKWSELQQDYTFESYRALDVTASYSGKWQAWQAARAQQSGEGLEGWRFERESGDRITIDADGLGFYVARMDAERIADIMLYALAQDLLSTTPPSDKP